MIKKLFKRSVCNDKTIVKYNFMLEILDHCISIPHSSRADFTEA